MTYAAAVTAAKEAFEAGNYKLSNFHLFIAAGSAKGEELATIQRMVRNNDNYAARA